MFVEQAKPHLRVVGCQADHRRYYLGRLLAKVQAENRHKLNEAIDLDGKQGTALRIGVLEPAGLNVPSGAPRLFAVQLKSSPARACDGLGLIGALKHAPGVPAVWLDDTDPTWQWDCVVPQGIAPGVAASSVLRLTVQARDTKLSAVDDSKLGPSTANAVTVVEPLCWCAFHGLDLRILVSMLMPDGASVA